MLSKIGLGKKNYIELVSGHEVMKTVLRIFGDVLAKMESQFIIFRHLRRTYSIKGYLNKYPGISYRTQTSGLIALNALNTWP